MDGWMDGWEGGRMGRGWMNRGIGGWMVIFICT